MATPITFLKETREELGKVVWPTKEQVLRSTVIVILVSLIVGVFLGAVDYVFTKIVEAVVG